MSESQRHHHKRICHHCDLLIDVPCVSKNEQVYCPRCGSTLELGSSASNQVSFHILLAAFLCFIMAVFAPFLNFDAGVRSNEVSLASGMANVFEFDEPLFGLLILLLVVVYPFFLLVTLLTILSPIGVLIRNRRSFRSMIRWSSGASKWVLVEVFILGVIVSLTKISELAEIGFGMGFYLYAAFAVMLNYGLKEMHIGSLLDRKGDCCSS